MYAYTLAVTVPASQASSRTNIRNYDQYVFETTVLNAGSLEAWYGPKSQMALWVIDCGGLPPPHPAGASDRPSLSWPWVPLSMA